MYQNILQSFMYNPAPYESTGISLWDDPHIAIRDTPLTIRQGLRGQLCP